ncbi:MAG: flagellar basal-body rod protein FlgG [Lentisphaerae bacterium]|nr:flagellar basal-body rod protein FlgG [Lentisphaerota bacterium]
MERALWTAASAMRAQELYIDTIANNLANVNTTAFKNSRTNFQDMLYTALTTAGAPTADSQIPVGIQVGHGTRVVSVSKLFDQGAIKETGAPLDFAIEGDGFFQVALPDGTNAYTRDGTFKITGAGQVVTSDGYLVNGFDTIDPDTTEITVAPDGTFSTIVNGAQVQKTRVTLVRFMNPEGLRSIGRNLYTETDSSGAPQTGSNPGENGTGTLAQKFLENSNVKVAEELVSMITAQRAYEASSKAIKASDEMMTEANGLRR